MARALSGPPGKRDHPVNPENGHSLLPLAVRARVGCHRPRNGAERALLLRSRERRPRCFPLTPLSRGASSRPMPIATSAGLRCLRSCGSSRSAPCATARRSGRGNGLVSWTACAACLPPSRSAGFAAIGARLYRGRRKGRGCHGAAGLGGHRSNPGGAGKWRPEYPAASAGGTWW